jgi:type II secretory pathway component PulM
MSAQLPQLKALENRIEQLSEEIAHLRNKSNVNGETDSVSEEAISRIVQKIRKMLNLLDEY